MTSPAKKYLQWTPPEIMLAILFLIAPLYYHPNIGGEGLRIPHNVTIWLAAILFIALSFSWVIKNKTILLPSTFWLILAFPVLATLGGFLAGIDQPLKWAFRMLFIWGGGAFLLAVLQQKLTEEKVNRLLYLIIVFGLVHVSIGISQFYFQNNLPIFKSPNGAPSGLFQQINNHSTYLVTLIVATVYLLTPSQAVTQRWTYKFPLLLFILGGSFIVGVSGSRIGALTLLISLIVLLFGRFRAVLSNKLVIGLLMVALISGFSTGVISSKSRVIDKVLAMDSGFSADARLSIYTLSAELFLEKPFFGHGIGSFPSVFQNAKPYFYDKNPEATFGNSLISHPHNELFFWMVESGLAALIGIFLTTIGIAFALWRSGYQTGLTYLALLLPISLHAQVELPFYVSALHWFLFLFITAICLKDYLIEKPLVVSQSMLTTTKITFVTAITLLIVFLLHTMYANQQLIGYRDSNRFLEKDYLYHPLRNPYIGEAALELDMRVLFYSAIERNDVDFLHYYTQWAEDRVDEEPKPYLLKNLAIAYFGIDNQREGCRIMNTAISIYPDNNEVGDLPSECQ